MNKPKIERFEDLIAWQRARVLTRNVYQATQAGPLGRDTGLARQMQRASVSIMSNIAEGFDRDRFGEFHQFLSVAKGSCAELRTQLYVALDVGYLDQESFDHLMTQATEVARIIGGLRASIERQLHTTKSRH